MLFRIFVFIVFLCLLKQHVFAQEGSYSNNNDSDTDTLYVQSYRHLLTVRALIHSKYNHISFKSQTNDNKFTYSTNQGLTVGGGFNYKWLGLNASFALPILKKNDAKFGYSSGFDVQALLFFKKWTGSLQFEKLKGFYEYHSDLIFPINNVIDDQGATSVNSNFRTLRYHAELNRVFNWRKFSTRAPLQHTEKQKKSAGTFLLGAYASLTNLQSDKGLIPIHLLNKFQLKGNYSKSDNLNFGINGGYAYTFVFGEHWYSTISAELGLGLVWNKLYKLTPITSNPSYNSNVITSTNLGIREKLFISLGYNNDRFFGGLSYVLNNNTFLGSSNINTIFSNGFFRIHIGTRFDTKKWKRKK
jgi:hypothetical protein